MPFGGMGDQGAGGGRGGSKLGTGGLPSCPRASGGEHGLSPRRQKGTVACFYKPPACVLLNPG